MKLLVAAGGTGGHIFPGVSVAEAFAGRKGNEVLFTGTRYGMEERLVPSAGFRLVLIEAKPFTGQSTASKVGTLLALCKGVAQARRLIKAERPDAIIGMGGFTCVPVLVAGILLRVPSFLHEQNVYPGMANRLLSGRVRATFVSFAESEQYLKAKAVVHTGNPIRRRMRGTRAEKTDSNFNIFVFGGSRGARSINEGVIGLLPYLEGMRQTVLYHQTGTDDFERVKTAYEGSGTVHEVFPFTDEMEKYYNLADVVVSRAGASTIFELSYFRKPAILVPYPFSAGAHQWKNASHVERVGGAYVIGNSEFSGEALYRTLTELRANPDELRRMSEGMGSIYVEAAEERIVREIETRVS
jgi:UDP-N-acetylglucosamine--N-acetylmuramyl-(pentapeptide) pyrophosphoryl-undecaprenol N-acetylglucosamine transferase